MDQVVENLWLGDITSIMDVESLKNNNILSILSVVRGAVVIQGVSVYHKNPGTSTLISPADLHPQTN